MGSGFEKLSFTDEENETQRCHLISPSNKGIRTHHLMAPTIQAQHPHRSSDSGFMQPCQVGIIGWEKMKILLESVQDNHVCLVQPHIPLFVLGAAT